MVSEKEYERLIKRISSNIKKIRESKELTQEEMTQFGFNYRHYQKIESGNHSFNLFTLFRLSKVFKVDIADFFAK